MVLQISYVLVMRFKRRELLNNSSPTVMVFHLSLSPSLRQVKARSLTLIAQPSVCAAPASNPRTHHDSLAYPSRKSRHIIHPHTSSSSPQHLPSTDASTSPANPTSTTKWRPRTAHQTPHPTSSARSKSLSPTTHLCLPRVLPSTSSSSALSSTPSPTTTQPLSAFTRLPTPRLHQQTPLQQHAPATALLRAITANGTSALHNTQPALLPALVIVRTATQPAHLRAELDILAHLHAEREGSTLHIGPVALRAQLTGSAESSWVCYAPVFGPTLRELGEVVAARGSSQFYLPSWFLAHVFLQLVAGLEFLAAAGVAGGGIRAETVVVSLYPRGMHYRYRGYPDVVLADFSAATRGGETDDGGEGDVRGSLELMVEAVSRWSDSAPFIGKATVDGVVETDEPLLLMMQSVRELLAAEKGVSLGEVRMRFGATLERLRHEGPQHIPWTLFKVLHSDLATEEEFERALREPTVLKFETRLEEAAKILAGEPVVAGPGGCVGMKTKRIMVAKFTTKKEDYAKIVGMRVRDEDMEMTDADAEGEEVEEMEM